MMHRMTFFAGMAVGYVLGTRAGRERYEQIKRAAQKIIESPQVKEAADSMRAQAGDLAAKARDKGKEVAGTAKVKAESMAGAAKEMVGDKLPHRSHGMRGAYEAVRAPGAQGSADARPGAPNRTTAQTRQ